MEFEVKGIIPAMVTPFNKRGKINKGVLRDLTNHLIKGGVHGLFPIGSTGEFYGLSRKQKKEVIETVLEEVNSRVPVYAGSGQITTRDTIAVTKMVEAIGVDAVSIITPMFIKPDQDELYNHYRAIASSVNLPILLYNNPARTGINLSAQLVARLSKIDNIVGIKDSSGDMTLTAEFIQRTETNFSILAGLDTFILSTLVYGGKGSISSTANIAPMLSVKIYEEYYKGNMEEARQAQFSLAPLRQAFNLGTFPVVIKEGLKLIGIDCGPTLEPVKSLGKEKRSRLKNILKEIGVI